MSSSKSKSSPPSARRPSKGVGSRLRARRAPGSAERSGAPSFTALSMELACALRGQLPGRVGAAVERSLAGFSARHPALKKQVGLALRDGKLTRSELVGLLMRAGSARPGQAFGARARR